MASLGKTALHFVMLWLLFAAPLFAEGNKNRSPTYQDISVAQFITQINKNRAAKNNDMVILDVRTENEFAAGFIKSATHLDFYLPTFKTSLDALPKHKTYFVYCHSGGRSANAMALMQAMGFQTVYNLLGGITAWKAASYPVVLRP